MLAVELHHIGKIYRIYSRPSDRLKELIFRKNFHQEFVALENISFSVPEGQTLGIIGANGAGKSTLLKILSGTLKQTSGELVSRGRIAALLELGAGFHPEFSGRQNIHLNASLMGLSKNEIKQKEGEIIAFAELEEFIDRPVKTYSSGMYIRLGFSIATMVNPDTLIIDEALSVGDQRFQKKCIDRMMHFRNAGKTILFCSHSMYHISQLCDQVVWIHRGSIAEVGDKDRVISSYEDFCAEKKNGDDGNPYAASPVRIESIQIGNDSEEELKTVQLDDDICIRIGIVSYEKKNIHVGVGFQSIAGDYIFGVTTKTDAMVPVEVVGSKFITIFFPKIKLMNSSFQAFGVLLDEFGLHVYDLKLSKPLVISKNSDVYGKVFLEHQWRF